MTSSQIDTAEAIATSVKVTNELLSASLADGRVISVPLAWYPRLVHAAIDERSRWELHAEGRHIHWPDIDEDLSVDGLLAGRPSGESDASLQKWLKARRNRKPVTIEAPVTSPTDVVATPLRPPDS